MAKSVTGLTSGALPNVDQKPKPWHTGKDVNAGLNKKKKRRGLSPANKMLQMMMLQRMMQQQQQQPQPQPGPMMPPQQGPTGPQY